MTKILIILFSLISISYPSFGNDTKIAQYYLNKLGFDAGPIDGFSGTKTKEAINQFYQNQGKMGERKIDQRLIKLLIAELKNSNNKNIHYGSCIDQLSSVDVKEEEYSSSLNLFYHKLVSTNLPAFRSFSFGSTDPSIGPGVSPEIKSVGDLNNDDIDDLVIDYYESGIAPIILLGSKDGTFKKLEYPDASAMRRHIRNAELADLNNDGWLDFVGFTTGSNSKRWMAEGGETLGKKIPHGEKDIVLLNMKGKSFRSIEIPEIRKNDFNHGGTTADLNNDGFVDILTLSEGEKQKTVPIQNITGTSFKLGKHEYSKEVSYYLTPDIDSGDFNKDGYQDFVVAVTADRPRTPSSNNAVGTLRVIYGDGDFDFSNNLEVKFGKIWLTENEGKKIVDQFDGKMSVGAGHNNLKILTGPGNVEVLDVDGDGWLDILEGQYFTVSGFWSGSGFKFYRNTGECFVDATDQFFPNQKTNRNFKSNLFTSYIHNFRMADINSDGLPDLLLQTDGAKNHWIKNDENKGFPYIFINRKNKVFLPVEYKKSNMEGLLKLDDIVPGDFNGDGKTDILGISVIKDKPKILALLQREISSNEETLKKMDKFRGDYWVKWEIYNDHLGIFETTGFDRLTLKDGKGFLTSNELLRSSGGPSLGSRSNLEITYNIDGNISAFGNLDYHCCAKSEFFFQLSGNLNNKYLEDFNRKNSSLRYRLHVGKSKDELMTEDDIELEKIIALENRFDYQRGEGPDNVAGDYWIEWSMLNTRNHFELKAYDKLILKNGSVTIEPGMELRAINKDFEFSLGPKPENRSLLTAKYNRDGEIWLEGNLGFDCCSNDERFLPYKFVGKIENGFFRDQNYLKSDAQYRLRVSRSKKELATTWKGIELGLSGEEKYFLFDKNSGPDPFEGDYLVEWSLYNKMENSFERTSIDRLYLKEGKGILSPSNLYDSDQGPSIDNRNNLEIRYNRAGEILFAGDLDYANYWKFTLSDSEDVFEVKKLFSFLIRGRVDGNYFEDPDRLDTIQRYRLRILPVRDASKFN